MAKRVSLQQAIADATRVERPADVAQEYFADAARCVQEARNCKRSGDTFTMRYLVDQARTTHRQARNYLRLACVYCEGSGVAK